MDNRARCGDLLVVVKRLTAVLDMESERALAMNLHDLVGVQEEKATLAATYADMARAFKRDPAQFHAADPALRAALASVMRRFRASAEANERALSAAREAGDRVMKAIIASAASQRLSPSYAGRLGPHAPARAERRPALSVAVDQRL